MLFYFKEKSLPVVTFFRLFKVKKYRNIKTSAVFLPSDYNTRQLNLKWIDELLSKNKVDYTTIESHTVFGSDQYKILIDYLKNEA